MGCRNDDQKATNQELLLSRVACLLDELDGKSINPHHWRGYHPRVYNCVHGTLGDELVSQLCSRLQTLDVKKYSLEMQIWWRDHQAADKARCENELRIARTNKEREAILAKLSPHERKVLGL